MYMYTVYIYSYVQHIICIYKITAWGSVRIPRFLSREKSCHPLLNGKGSKSTIPTTKRRCAQAALLNDWCALAKLVELQQRKKINQGFLEAKIFLERSF